MKLATATASPPTGAWSGAWRTPQASQVHRFTDICIKQGFYQVKLQVSKAPAWQKNMADEAVNTTITRSWNDSLVCVNCEIPHSIMDKQHFILIISDQHQPCKIPAFEGICVAIIRLQDVTFAQLIDHTTLLIKDAALAGERARSPDEFGACSVLQTGLDQAKDI